MKQKSGPEKENAQVPIKDVTLLRDVSVAFRHHRPARGAVAVSTDILPEPGRIRWPSLGRREVGRRGGDRGD
jgi:hypothetical protein